MAGLPKTLELPLLPRERDEAIRRLMPRQRASLQRLEDRRGLRRLQNPARRSDRGVADRAEHFESGRQHLRNPLYGDFRRHRTGDFGYDGSDNRKESPC